MILQDLHHVAIICADYERSKQFYVDILGCRIIQETYRAERESMKLDLQFGKHSQLELFSFPDPPPRINNPEAQGLRHLAFQVDNLESAVSHLERHNITVEPIRVDELTGKRFTFFKDPDNLPLELYEK